MTKTRTDQLSKNYGRGVGLDFQPGHRKASEGKKIKKINASFVKPPRTLAPLPTIKHGGPRGLHLMNVEA